MYVRGKYVPMLIGLCGSGPAIKVRGSLSDEDLLRCKPHLLALPFLRYQQVEKTLRGRQSFNSTCTTLYLLKIETQMQIALCPMGKGVVSGETYP